jgi:hypothetical protein
MVTTSFIVAPHRTQAGPVPYFRSDTSFNPSSAFLTRPTRVRRFGCQLPAKGFLPAKVHAEEGFLPTKSRNDAGGAPVRDPRVSEDGATRQKAPSPREPSLGEVVD